MKRKVLVTTIITSALAASFAFGAYAATKLTLIVNGKVANADIKVINGTTYLPLKTVGELLGAKVQFEASTKTIRVDGQSQPATESSPSTGTVTKPTQPGLSRSNPAPIGTEVTYAVDSLMDKYTAAITLEQVIRGTEAEQMILNANMFNDKAPAGYEYMLVKVNFKVLSNVKADAQVDISPLDFTLVSENGKDYEYASVVTPDPEFRASLYVGASNSGWIPYLVKTSDQAPLIAFGRNYDGTGGVWFKP